MAIRDCYVVNLIDGPTLTFQTTKQGGEVLFIEDAEDAGLFFEFRERTRSGAVVRTLKVAKSRVESVEFRPG